MKVGQPMNSFAGSTRRPAQSLKIAASGEPVTGVFAAGAFATGAWELGAAMDAGAASLAGASKAPVSRARSVRLGEPQADKRHTAARGARLRSIRRMPKTYPVAHPS